MEQGKRVSSGLGSVEQLSSLKLKLRPIVDRPTAPAFLEAIKSVDAAGTIPDIHEWGEGILEKATDEKQYGKLKGDPVSIDGVAYLMGYSDEATTPPLYQDMNTKSYNHDRSQIEPYGEYMVGMVKCMRDIEPYPDKQVFRGVKTDLKDQYPEGRKVTWYGFSSTTKSAKVLENPQFCGAHGKRTIFAIQLTQGQAREITRYSLLKKEDEILLPPGSRFEVKSVLPQGDLTIIQLEELPSKEWIVNLNGAGTCPNEMSVLLQSIPETPKSGFPAEFDQEIASLRQQTMEAMDAGDFGKVKLLGSKLEKAKAGGEAAAKKRKAEDVAATEELDRLAHVTEECLACVLDATSAVLKVQTALQQRKLAAKAEVAACFALLRGGVDEAEQNALDELEDGCLAKEHELVCQQAALEEIAARSVSATGALVIHLGSRTVRILLICRCYCVYRQS
jgi:hypothetical protein